MASSEYYIQRIDDASIFRTFVAARQSAETALSEAKSAGSLPHPGNYEVEFSFGTGLPWKPTADELLTAPPGQFILRSISLSFVLKSSTQFPNSTPTTSFVLLRDRSGTVADKFIISLDSTQGALEGPGAESVLRAMHVGISQILRPVAPQDGGLIPTLSNLAESFSTTYQRISLELSEAVTRVTNERSDQINEFKDERARLRSDMEAERTEWMRSAQADIEARRAALDQERLELEKARSQLEISSHKDARRRQFLKLQEDLQEMLKRPVVGAELRANRMAVFVALLSAGGVAAWFAHGSITAGSQLGSSPTGEWVFDAIRSATLTIASLASFLAAAAWLRFFYVRDVQALEELQHFSNDMARASWIMEAALEIRKEHNEVIPPEWISGVTQGLFAQGKSRDTVGEGAHALGALLALSGSAQFGPGGVSVELNKRGRKAIAEAGRELDQS